LAQAIARRLNDDEAQGPVLGASGPADRGDFLELQSAPWARDKQRHRFPGLVRISQIFPWGGQVGALFASALALVRVQIRPQVGVLAKARHRVGVGG